MVKTSTIHFSVHALGSKFNVNKSIATNNNYFEHEFSDVYQVLDELSTDVSQNTVDNILLYAAGNI